MSKPHWSKSESLIVDLLRDRAWHCPTVELEGLIKDDRARLTAIRRKLGTVGFTVESRKCNLHTHKSQILMRRIVPLERAYTPNTATKTQNTASPSALEINAAALKLWDELESAPTPLHE